MSGDGKDIDREDRACKYPLTYPDSPSGATDPQPPPNTIESLIVPVPDAPKVSGHYPPNLPEFYDNFIRLSESGRIEWITVNGTPMFWFVGGES